MPGEKNKEPEQTKKKEQGNNDSTEQKEKLGLSFYVLGAIAFLLITVALSSTLMFFAISTNFNNIAFKNRQLIEKVPILNRALLPILDPDNVDNFTQRQLRGHYIDVLEERNELRINLDELEEKFDTIKKEVLEFREKEESFSKELELLAEKKEKLKESKEEFNVMVANNKREEFGKFFEEVEAEKAKQIYKDIMESRVQDALKEDLAEIYKNMPVDSTASILIEISKQDINLVVDIMRMMDKNVAGDIITQMSEIDLDFATKLSTKLVK